MLKVVCLSLFLVVGLIGQNVLANYTITKETTITVAVPTEKLTMTFDADANSTLGWYRSFVLRLSDCTYYVYCHFRTEDTDLTLFNWPPGSRPCCHFMNTIQSCNDIFRNTSGVYYAPLTITADKAGIRTRGTNTTGNFPCANNIFKKQSSGKYTVEISVSENKNATLSPVWPNIACHANKTPPNMTLFVKADVFTPPSTTTTTTPKPTTTTTTTTALPTGVTDTIKPINEGTTGMFVVKFIISIIIIICIISFLIVLMAMISFLACLYMKKKKAEAAAMVVRDDEIIQPGASKTAMLQAPGREVPTKLFE